MQADQQLLGHGVQRPCNLRVTVVSWMVSELWSCRNRNDDLLWIDSVYCTWAGCLSIGCAFVEISPIVGVRILM